MTERLLPAIPHERSHARQAGSTVLSTEGVVRCRRT
jgi:hypothetical protein